MKLKTLAHVAMITCSILALSACSSKHKTGMDGAEAAGTYGADGAQASGMNQTDEFAGGQAGPGQSLQKRTFYFEFDRSDVREQDKPAVMANANYLIAHPDTRVTLEGHTDPRGSREYNVALGERRANAVADMMRAKGVNPNQIRVVSYGAERLATPGRSEQDYQMDRRVVIVYQN